MTEFVQGPVQPWKPKPEDEDTIEQLLVSKDELERAYGEAYKARCFVQEFGGRDENSGLAAVGELDSIETISFRLGKEIKIAELSMGECIELGARPGRGNTRAERVRDGLRKIEEARVKTAI